LKSQANFLDGGGSDMEVIDSQEFFQPVNITVLNEWKSVNLWKFKRDINWFDMT